MTPRQTMRPETVARRTRTRRLRDGSPLALVYWTAPDQRDRCARWCRSQGWRFESAQEDAGSLDLDSRGRPVLGRFLRRLDAGRAERLVCTTWSVLTPTEQLAAGANVADILHTGAERGWTLRLLDMPDHDTSMLVHRAAIIMVVAVDAYRLAGGDDAQLARDLDPTNPQHMMARAMFAAGAALSDAARRNGA